MIFLEDGAVICAAVGIFAFTLGVGGVTGWKPSPWSEPCYVPLGLLILSLFPLGTAARFGWEAYNIKLSSLGASVSTASAALAVASILLIVKFSWRWWVGPAIRKIARRAN